MGPELDRLFHALSVELIWIHLKWEQFRILFAEDPANVDLVNEAAPLFFRIVQDSLGEDTLLAIARLVGPVVSSGKRNLVIDRILPLLPDQSLRAEVSGLVAEAKRAGSFAIDWRNRRLAHRDLDLAVGLTAVPLPTASREKIETVLSALRAVLNRVDDAYGNAEMAYDTPMVSGDAKPLLRVLQDGLQRRRDSVTRRVRAARPANDVRPPD